MTPTVVDVGGLRIVSADALDAVKVENTDLIMPPHTLEGTPAQPRALTTPLIERLRDHPDEIDANQTTTALISAVLDGRGHEYLPFTGQTAGLIHDIAPAATILDRIVAEAEIALAAAHETLATT